MNQPCEELVEEENVQYKLVLKIENVTDFLTKKFPEYLLNRRSLKLFKRLGINLSFLEIDPTEWKNNTNYKFGKKVVDALHIVNDTTERGVKLIEEFNEKFTKNEEQKQCLLQVSILNKAFLKYKKIKNIIIFFFRLYKNTEKRIQNVRKNQCRFNFHEFNVYYIVIVNIYVRYLIVYLNN